MRDGREMLGRVGRERDRGGCEVIDFAFASAFTRIQHSNTNKTGNHDEPPREQRTHMLWNTAFVRLD